MAGGDYHPFKVDPSIERWQEMHNSMYTRFRMTPSKTRMFILWGLTVPLITYWGAKYTDNRWDWRARGREDSLLRKPPQPEQSDEADE
ncbi:hypothetical protein BCV69DRAFT_296262 [Microstroma glucosiphilum]|uniref:Complex I-B15 n=1 Tax=Pseudomicrostroma glucosiphilum TaxID=1684307 RepID=A0A316UFC4_9BASI|nr:hypothetical protein BCV69DRAFT_296262 [Pseudomicrostroma glucosiphilum]PWN23956.1 hypothetical protein BCV69DRAFT_296262 [Pseudomicrostroma glucosiphilum]